MNVLNHNIIPRARRAFTLIELLTVIAIVGILAAILIPTVGAVRIKATQAKVLGNLRQLGMAMRSYASDNRDYLPAANYNYGSGLVAPWDDVILPYLGIKANSDGYVQPAAETLFFHPRDQAVPHASRARRSFGMPREGSLTVGGVARSPVGLHNPSAPAYRRGTLLSKVTDQSRVILLTERRDMGSNSFVNNGSFADINVSALAGQIDEPEKTYKINGGSGTLDFLFVDGHVKAMKLIDTVGRDEFPAGTINSPRGMWFVR